MADPLYVVAGATGHIGTELVKRLVAAGKRVRALGRDAGKLKRTGAAETAMGSLDDAMFLKRAVADATAVFALVPPHYASGDYPGFQRRTVESWAQALPASGATHVVALSSLGAHLPAGTGPIAGLHAMEQRFAGLVPHLLLLRPAYFLENHLAGLGMVRGMNIYGSAIAPGVAMPMIATRDIAAVAAAQLGALEFQGTQVRELLGARDYTHAEVARTIGKEIGKPDLPYVQFPYEDARKSMIGGGLSPSVADGYIEMSKAFNDGLIKPTQPRDARTTTPTTLGQFAKQFAAAYKASGG